MVSSAYSHVRVELYLFHANSMPCSALQNCVSGMKRGNESVRFHYSWLASHHSRPSFAVLVTSWHYEVKGKDNATGPSLGQRIHRKQSSALAQSQSAAQVSVVCSSMFVTTLSKCGGFYLISRASFSVVFAFQRRLSTLVARYCTPRKLCLSTDQN